MLGINFPKNYISVTYKYFSGINVPKTTFHVFVCDSESYIQKKILELFSRKVALQLRKTMFFLFVINFRLECKTVDFLLAKYRFQIFFVVSSASGVGKGRRSPRRKGGLNTLFPGPKVPPRKGVLQSASLRA